MEKRQAIAPGSPIVPFSIHSASFSQKIPGRSTRRHRRADCLIVGKIIYIFYIASPDK